MVVWGKLENPLLATHFNIFWIYKQAFTHYCHLHEPSLDQQILIVCDKILLSHTQRGYQFLFLDYFIIFNFFLLFYVIINFHKNYFIIIIILLYFFSWKLFLFLHVPGCSEMFRDVPACSVFRVLSTAFLQGVQTSYRLTNSLSKSSKKWLLAN